MTHVTTRPVPHHNDNVDVLIDGRVAATIQGDTGGWRIVIPFGQDRVMYATVEDAVAAVVEMRKKGVAT